MGQYLGPVIRLIRKSKLFNQTGQELSILLREPFKRIPHSDQDPLVYSLFQRYHKGAKNRTNQEILSRDLSHVTVELDKVNFNWGIS